MYRTNLYIFNKTEYFVKDVRFGQTSEFAFRSGNLFLLRPDFKWDFPTNGDYL